MKEIDEKAEARKDRIWFYSWLIPFTAIGAFFMRWWAKFCFRRKR